MHYCFHNRAQQNVEISLVVSLQQPINQSIRKMFRRPKKKYHNYEYHEHFKAVEQKGRCAWLSMFSSFSFSINLRENGISTINRNFCEKFRKK